MAATVSSGELRNSAGQRAEAEGRHPLERLAQDAGAGPFQLPPNPLAGPAPAPRDRRAERMHPVDHPGARRTDRRPGAGAAVSSPARTAARRVQVGFAFCGACGTRIGAAASGPQRRCQPRTMFMAGSTAAAPAVVPRGRLILIRPDGSEGGAHRSTTATTSSAAARRRCSTPTPTCRRATPSCRSARTASSIRDLQSLNGVFLKIATRGAARVGRHLPHRPGAAALRGDLAAAAARGRNRGHGHAEPGLLGAAVRRSSGATSTARRFRCSARRSSSAASAATSSSPRTATSRGRTRASRCTTSASS